MTLETWVHEIQNEGACSVLSPHCADCGWADAPCGCTDPDCNPAFPEEHHDPVCDTCGHAVTEAP